MKFKTLKVSESNLPTAFIIGNTLYISNRLLVDLEGKYTRSSIVILGKTLGTNWGRHSSVPDYSFRTDCIANMQGAVSLLQLIYPDIFSLKDGEESGTIHEIRIPE